MLSRLLNANRAFSPSAGFCCSSAWSGTVKAPGNPSPRIAAQANGYDGSPDQRQCADAHAE